MVGGPWRGKRETEKIRNWRVKSGDTYILKQTDNWKRRKKTYNKAWERYKQDERCRQRETDRQTDRER